MNDLSKIALKAIQIAQSEILKYYQTDVGVEWKADSTPVTIADQNAEEKMREFFYRETPEFGVIGEEFDNSRPEADYQWIIDPIDGTKSFICGVPLFGTLLALYYKNEGLFGAINIIGQDKCLWAEKGLGAFVGESQVQVSAQQDLSKAVVLSGTINTMETEGYAENFKKLRHDAWLYRGWGDCYGYYQVATGRAEVMFDPIVSVWDIAPLPVIMRETGGQFSDVHGNELVLHDGTCWKEFTSDDFTGLATNSYLHSKAVEYLNFK